MSIIQLKLSAQLAPVSKHPLQLFLQQNESCIEQKKGVGFEVSTACYV